MYDNTNKISYFSKHDTFQTKDVKDVQNNTKINKNNTLGLN